MGDILTELDGCYDVLTTLRAEAEALACQITNLEGADQENARLKAEVLEQAAKHADCCVDREELARLKAEGEALRQEIAAEQDKVAILNTTVTALRERAEAREREWQEKYSRAVELAAERIRTRDEEIERLRDNDAHEIEGLKKSLHLAEQNAWESGSPLDKLKQNQDRLARALDATLDEPGKGAK